MSDKVAIMHRPQKGALGLVVPGVMYDLNAKNRATFEEYVAAGFASFTTRAALEKAAAKKKGEAAAEARAILEQEAAQKAAQEEAAEKAAEQEAAQKAAEEEAAKQAAEAKKG